MARRQGAAWIAPGWNGLGVKRHAPRLAARQRGILAFMPLTVVGPGRLLVTGEAARVRPGDEVASPIARRCRSRSPPTERLRKAPLEEWIGMGCVYGEVNSLSRTISLMEISRKRQVSRDDGSAVQGQHHRTRLRREPETAP